MPYASEFDTTRRARARIAVRREVDRLPRNLRQILIRVLGQFERGKAFDLDRIAVALGEPSEVIREDFAKALLLLKRRLENNVAVREWLETLFC